MCAPEQFLYPCQPTTRASGASYAVGATGTSSAGRAIATIVVRSLGVAMTGSCAMRTIIDDLLPDELWALVNPCCRPPPAALWQSASSPDRNRFAAILFMARTPTPRVAAACP